VETVSLAQAAWNGRTYVQTDLYSRACLTPGEKPADWPLKEFTPAASYPGQWVEHRLVMDETGRLSREAPVPSREVVVSHWYGASPETIEECFHTVGHRVWTMSAELKSGKWPFQEKGPFFDFKMESRPFNEFLAERRHPDARVEQLRDAMLSYWCKFHRREGRIYTFGWMEGVSNRQVFSAGTLVVGELPETINIAY
jgi:hypothetical protein